MTILTRHEIDNLEHIGEKIMKTRRRYLRGPATQLHLTSKGHHQYEIQYEKRTHI